MRKALFLDRDGVINKDFGYVHKKEDTVFLDGIFEIIAHAKRNGYLVFVITNQAGIGRGYFAESDFHLYMQWMLSVFKNKGCVIDGYYYCPHHPIYGLGTYRVECDCRKPKPAQIKRAAEEHSISLEHSVLIGDKYSDLEAGRTAGIRDLFLVGNRPGESIDGFRGTAYKRLVTLCESELWEALCR